MKNLGNMVLKFLYKNDTGSYVDLYKRFVTINIHRKRIDEIVDDLKIYIDQESIYAQRGISYINDDLSNNVKPLKELNVKINQKGRERYEAILNARKTRIINKKTATYVLISVIIAALSFLVPLYRNLKKKNEIIPLITVHIDNQRENEISIFHYQEFFLWFPGSGNHTIGRYEIINQEGNDIIKLHPGLSIVSARILDNSKYISFYKSREYDLSLSIKLLQGGLFISEDLMPFDKESISKYYTTIKIDKHP